MTTEILTKNLPALPATTRVFTCPACTWVRNLNPDYRDRVYRHPIYGKVTGEQMAQLDIAKHKCHTYKAALARLGRKTDPNEEFADVIDLDTEIGWNG